MSSIEQNVCKRILERAEVGKSKYGVTMEREDLSRLEWLKHAQEELLDGAVYLQKLIEMEEEPDTDITLSDVKEQIYMLDKQESSCYSFIEKVQAKYSEYIIEVILCRESTVDLVYIEFNDGSMIAYGFTEFIK